MKTFSKILAILLIVIIIVGIGAYAAYYYTQNNSKPSPTPTPTPTSSPSPSPTLSPSPTASPTSSPSPTPSPTPMPSATTLNVATTTSLHDTGLEDLGINGNTTGTIKSFFQAKYPWITVNFLALGTGDAIKKAQSGDADMILVHSPSQELPFLTGGYGVDRKIIAYNFFIIVGPPNDPAHINGLSNVTQAMINIYNASHTGSNPTLWFSRNDASGTNTKEISLWTAAGYNYTQLTNTTLNGSWFKSTGSGMGQTLLTANYYGSIGGYTLSDTGTYLAYYERGDIQLTIQIQAQQSLLNVYSAIIDNPQNSALASTNFNASLLFVNYLVSSEGQQLIQNFGQTAYNQSLFTPYVPLATGTVSNDTLLGWIKSYAYMNSIPSINATGTECPLQFRYNAGNLYSATYDAVANINANLSFNSSNYYITDKKQVTLTQPTPIQSSIKIYMI